MKLDTTSKQTISTTSFSK